MLGWIGGVDALLPNADEAAALTGEDEPERAARALVALAGAREVAVTLGVTGAVSTDGAAIVRVLSPAAGGGRGRAGGVGSRVRDRCSGGAGGGGGGAVMARRSGGVGVRHVVWDH
ncbi:MAG TPA: PfkB family carbohydrate kinase [Baekduia sp.]|uniref:PfkB family carbohydrate kinase n=1 Tax=Baekduia sp. TaxID=2600305 RepID=UPI002C23CCEC|nr:PfkB family carbohydrate kinase [Baekduia sp.]HMJ32436.1 PfkB family carbohydrate kinase [Baekduia sp.]